MISRLGLRTLVTMEDWFGGSACLTGSEKGGRRMQKLFVGIDVSKDPIAAAGLNPAGIKLFYISCSMDAEGFAEIFQSKGGKLNIVD